MKSGVHCETCLRVCVFVCVCVQRLMREHPGLSGAGALWGLVCPPGASRYWIDWIYEDSSCPHDVSVFPTHRSSCGSDIEKDKTKTFENFCAACASAVLSRCAGFDWDRGAFFSV